MNQLQKEARSKAFIRLLTIMDELREKCPWDKKQTLESLQHLTIEETYELTDAILEKDYAGLKGELGDLFLHLVFYSKICEELQKFDIADVLNTVCEKLIERHPHIYGDVTVQDEEEVKANWEKIKLKSRSGGVLSGVPKGLPAVVKAQRIQEKAQGVGFDWDNSVDVWAKVKEELTEFEQEIAEADQEGATSEFGDLMFSLINYARHVGINPEEALERSNKKFIRRFTTMEDNLSKKNGSFEGKTLQELDTLWNQAKKEELN